MEKQRDLTAWLTEIEQGHSKAIDLTLDRITEVASRGKLLAFSCPVITVAGTNGKGSTVTALGTLLRAAGLNVGTYTSPHLLHFNERIQINGQPVLDEFLCASFERIAGWRKDTPLTFFEFTTLAAFDIFKQQTPLLDVIILEVGMGGRLDAVNAISPSLAMITSIGRDHEQWLGDTLEKIAFEKSGILRPEIPLVLSAKARFQSIAKQVAHLRNQVFVEGEDFDFCDARFNRWQFKNQQINLPIFSLPTNSVSLALAAYTILAESTFSLPALEKVAIKLEKLTLLGRFTQVQYRGKNVILDVAHNEAASMWLSQKLRSMNQIKMTAVWASMADKHLSGIIAPLKESINTWCVAGLSEVERACSDERLMAALREQNIAQMISFPSIGKAFEWAIDNADSDETVVVFGSFYTVAAVLAKIAES